MTIHDRILGCAVLLLATSVVQAAPAPDEEIRPHDTVVFRNTAGNEETLVGEILKETFDAIEFRVLSGGSFELKKSGVVKIVKRRTPREVYETKRKKLPRPEADAEARARASLSLGLWCRTPHPLLAGAPPASEQAHAHLLKAVQLEPDLHEAYPHLLDILAQRREQSESTSFDDGEVQIYLLAEKGGYRHPEIEFRMGEIYLTLDLLDAAKARFEAVLARQNPRNRSLARRARHYLSRIFLSRGEATRALEFFDAGASDFETNYLGARVLLNQGGDEARARARELLEKARKLQPDFPGVALQLASIDLLEGRAKAARDQLVRGLRNAGDDAEFHTALGLVALERGRFTSAGKKFRQALEIIEPLKGTVRWKRGLALAECQAHVGLGVIGDGRGDLSGAVSEYRAAIAASPGNAVASLYLSGALSRFGAADEATGILEAALRTHSRDAALFVANTRALADLEIARGDEEQALVLLGYAVELDPEDPALRSRMGHLLMGQGRLEAAYRHLDAAGKLGASSPELLCAVAYYHYTRGDMAAAETVFRGVLGKVPAPRPNSKGFTPPTPPARLYAERGLARVIDSYEFEVWWDRFDRDDGEEIRRGWLEYENYGVRVVLEDGLVRFGGAQTNDAVGVTMIYRAVELRDARRISARFRVPVDSRVRAGIRLESSAKDVGVGLVFFRDFDGTLRFSVKTTRSDWEDAVPTAADAESAATGKLVFPGSTTWPADADFHVLMIRQASGRNRSGYDLLLDGESVASNVSIGSFGGRTKVVQVGVSGQVESLGVSQDFEVDDFRVYRKRAKVVKRGRR